MKFPHHLGNSEIRRVWGSGGEFEVVQGFAYRPAPEITISIGRGWQTDLASIPRWFQGFFVKLGKHDRAAIIHDWLYMTGKLTYLGKDTYISRKLADQVFLQALLYFGVKRRYAYPMYWAVRAGGGKIWESHNHPSAQLKSFNLP